MISLARLRQLHRPAISLLGRSRVARDGGGSRVHG